MSEPTRWSLIDAVRRAEPEAERAFVGRYLPVIRAYLAARWGRTPLRDELEDAAQEVMTRCLGPRGALARLEPGHPSGLRGYLFGVTRNVALEFERQRNAARGAGSSHARGDGSAQEVEFDEETPSRAFARAYARGVMREARARYLATCQVAGPDAVRRHDLLVLRLEDGVAIRDIAVRWGIDAAVLHHEYARARKDYREALLEAIAEEHPGLGAERLREAAMDLMQHLE